MASEYELRLLAAEKGEKRYQGRPCLAHPHSLRYTSNGACVDCTNVSSQAKQERIRELLKKNSAA